MTEFSTTAFKISSALFVFSMGTIAGAIATAGFQKLAIRIHFSAPYNPIANQHQEPVAYLGGLGVATPLILYIAWQAITSSAAAPAQLFPLALASSIFLILGLLDDALSLGPKRKIVLQFFAAGVACAVVSVAPLTGIALFDFLLSMLWIVAVINAVNFTDVSDGLVGGLSCIALFSFALLIPELQTFLIIGAGACLGFLWLNRPPARIFLGDAGSHFLGSLLALLGIVSVQNGLSWSNLLSVILVLGIFLLEMTFITWVRIKKGIPWWRGSPDHFSLRMQAAGYSRSRINALTWIVALLLAATGIFIHVWPMHISILVISGLIVLIVLVWKKMLSLEVTQPEAMQPQPLQGAPDGDCGLCKEAAISRFIDTGVARVGICSSCGTGRVLTLNFGPRGPGFVDSYAEAYATERRSDKALSCMEVFDTYGPKPESHRKLLEIGCGRGEFLDLAREAGWDTTGVEISRVSAAVVKQSGHHVSQSSALDFLPDSPGHFSAVVMWDLLEHLDSPRIALENCIRWLRPGGTLVLVTPFMGSFYDRLGLFAHSTGLARRNPLLRMCWSQAHLYRFSPSGLREELVKIGFSDVFIEPKLLLSLSSDRYAGGDLMPRWSQISFLNRLGSRLGVAAASRFSLENKVVVVARKQP
ncbi:MAG: methyltransferase domain-containing protein [Myxococcota bacterium]|nr:methyltransferase domain-containing protein [Myxococcota bacterium]